MTALSRCVTGGVAGLLVIAFVVLIVFSRRPPPPAPLPVIKEAVAAALPLPAAATGQAVLAKAISDDPAIERDLAFLYVSALEIRCDPADGHAMVKLAMAAGLPALRATGQLIAAQPPLGNQLYGLINDWVRRTPCATPLVELRLQDYRLRVAPRTYAHAFPESYVDPAMAPFPAGSPEPPDMLGEADSPCLRLAYRLLPLDGAEPWQCVAARRQLRQQIVHALCPVDIATAEAQAKFASTLHDRESRLPQMCR
jgi:hypothetical protein